MPERSCPSCMMQIDAAATSCPFCYQPVAPQEKGPQSEGAAPEGRRRREGGPWVWIGRLAILIAAGLILQVIFYKGPAPPTPAPAPVPAPTTPPAAAPAAPAKPAPPALKTLEPGYKGKTWFVYGSVFEATSLAPKAGAQLVFRDANDAQQLYGAKTDAKGAFSVALPANLGGFIVSLQDDDGKIMEDLIPSLRKMSRSERLELIRGNNEDAWSPSVMPAAGNRLRKDFVFVSPPALAAQKDR